MDRERKERIVDDVLNRALGPELVEPRDGFEQRILAKLATEPQRRRWWRWVWVPAIAAAAVLAIVMGLRMIERPTSKPMEANKAVGAPKQEVATKPRTPDNYTSARALVAKHKSAKPTTKAQVLVASTSALPRMDVFPAPAPLTEQERLLLALVNRQRPQAELLAAEQQAERDKAQKYFETGEAPAVTPVAAQPMR